MAIASEPSPSLANRTTKIDRGPRDPHHQTPMLADEQETAAACYLAAVRWRRGMACPHCGGGKVYRWKNLQRFGCAACGRTFSVRVGTIFQQSRLPLWKWIAIIQATTSSLGAGPTTKIATELGINQGTAWAVLRKLRFATHTPSFRAPLNDTAGLLDEDALPAIERIPTRRSYRVGYYRPWRLNLPWEQAVERFWKVRPAELALVLAAHDHEHRRPGPRQTPNLSLLEVIGADDDVALGLARRTT